MAERAAKAALSKAKQLGAAIIKAGRVIGAIGCGGGTGEQDHECAQAGAAAVAA